MKKVYIVSAVRTPLGSFGGILSSFSATKLGTLAIQGAINKANVPSESIDEVFMGNVCQANLGQAPARQAAIFSGIPTSAACLTINKVCGSGLKAMMLANDSICGVSATVDANAPADRVIGQRDHRRCRWTEEPDRVSNGTVRTYPVAQRPTDHILSKAVRV